MFKKITVLAMAIGAVAAFVLPASASAVWTHGHSQVVTQNKTLGLTGQIEFKSHAIGGGVVCQVTSQVDFFGNSTTGAITTFTPHPTSATANCKGQGGLAFCEIHNVTPTGLSPHPVGAAGWEIHTTGTAQEPDIQITYGEIHSQTSGGFCPTKRVTVTGGTITAIPVNTAGVKQNGKTVEAVTVQGTAFVHTGEGQAQLTDQAATAHGFLVVEGNDYKTYSL
jgi:uncharacterized membrane protein